MKQLHLLGTSSEWRRQVQPDRQHRQVLEASPGNSLPLRPQVLLLRDPQLRQRHRADLLHRLLPGIRVQELRPGGTGLLRNGAGRPARSHGQGVPQGDQVHLPQLWPLRHRWEERRPLCVAAQHHQREDLHLHLVLAHHRDLHHRPGPHLQADGSCHPQASCRPCVLEGVILNFEDFN